MGFFDFISDVGSAIFNGVKTIAKGVGKILQIVASVGEKVVKAVKSIWNYVKPIIKVASVLAKKALVAVAAVINPALVPLAMKIGTFIEGACKALLALDRSPILRKIGQWIEKGIKITKNIGQKLEKWADIQDAEKDLKTARENMAKCEKEISSDEKQAFLLAELLHKREILMAKVSLIIDENNVEGMDRYLQIRAIDKILKEQNNKFSSTKMDLKDITTDEHFVIDIADRILDNKIIEESELANFDNVFQKQFGKGMLPYVFAEMVKLWSLDLEKDRTQLKLKREILGKTKVQSKQLINETNKETVEKAQNDVLVLSKEIDELANEIIQRQTYIEAIEGLLLIYEKRLDESFDDDLQNAILAQVHDVGNCILQVMNESIKWDDLNTESKKTITDFANIFREHAVRRSKEFETEINNEKKLVEVAV